MLINFKFENFLSFKDANILSFETGSRLRKYKKNTKEVKAGKQSFKLLKDVIIFGANGHGKSNVLFALRAMKRGVIDVPRKSITKLSHPSFALNDYSKNTPTKFEVEFIYQEKHYIYSYSFTEEKIITEKLDIVDDNNILLNIINRNDSEFEVPEELEDLREITRDNLLFVQVAQEKNHIDSINVMEWFSKKLIFFSGNPTLANKLLNVENKNAVVTLLNAFGLYLEDLRVVKEKTPEDLVRMLTGLLEVMGEEIPGDGDVDSLPKTLKEQLKINLVYNQYNKEGDVVGQSDISYDSESEGTRKLIHFALHFLFSDSDSVIIMDEFDDSFHQTLSKKLLQLINSSSNKNQFLFTSHDLDLMDSGLRKDQIYFSEKKFTGETELYSIFDFVGEDQKRADLSYAKRYLNGVYGATPYISDIDKMMDTIQKNN